MPKTGREAILKSLADVVIHELTAEDGELISHEFDRMRTRHPIIVHAFLFATYVHLARLVGRRFDAYQGFGIPILDFIRRTFNR